MSKLKRQKSKAVPLVITFHPKLKLTGQLSSKHLHMSYMDRAFNKVYTPGLTATFHNGCKLGGYLV